MTDTLSHQETEVKHPQSAKDVYLSCLGLKEMPKEASNLPDEIRVASKYIGDLADSIRDSGQGATVPGERSQTIYVNKGKIEPQKVTIGKQNETHPEGNAMLQKQSFRLNPAFLHYHTHPGTNPPSFNDIEVTRSSSHGTYLDVVGEQNKVIVFAQTQKGMQIPLSVPTRMMRTTIALRLIESRHAESFNNGRVPYEKMRKEMAKDILAFLEKEGIGVYIQRFSEPEELKLGLALTRVTADVIEQAEDEIL